MPRPIVLKLIAAFPGWPEQKLEEAYQRATSGKFLPYAQLLRRVEEELWNPCFTQEEEARIAAVQQEVNTRALGRLQRRLHALAQYRETEEANDLIEGLQDTIREQQNIIDNQQDAIESLLEYLGGVPTMAEFNDIVEKMNRHKPGMNRHEGMARTEKIQYVGAEVGEADGGRKLIVLKINDHIFSASAKDMAEMLVEVADIVSVIGPDIVKGDDAPDFEVCMNCGTDKAPGKICHACGGVLIE